MKYFLIAGEASGDLHGADLITRLREEDSGAEIQFLGGDCMAAAAGVAPVIHYRDMAYMGFSEVLRHLGDIKRNMKRAKSAIDAFRPDAVILIDYPSFNLRIARYAKTLGINVYYYISPKVWAWKEWRVKQIRRDVDRVFSILPFEEEFYRRHGMDVEYVGNPSVIEVDSLLATHSNSADKIPTDGRPLLALVPGSRKGEIRNNLPIMHQVALRHPEMQSVIAGAPSIDLDFYRQYSDLQVVTGKTFEIMKEARCALVTSGTATLECALAGTPQIVCYRANGSKLAYKIMSRLLKVKYVSLPNLIVGREIIPEMLLHLCTPDAIDTHLSALAPDTPEREAQLQGYREMRHRLGSADPALTAARSIISDLKTR